MKKIMCLILLSFVFTACTSKVNTKYTSAVAALKNETVVSDIIPGFDASLKIEKNAENVLDYILTLSNPREPIYDIEIVLIHDKYTDDIFPSIGIFDQKLGLIPNVINEKSGYVKAVTLTGKIDYNGELKDFDGSFKAKISYTDQNLDSHIYYYTKQY